jgi:type I restriction enzyme S subunit
MKPTGLAWLPEAPAHWEVRRAKRLLKQTSIPVRPADEIVTCFRDGQVTLRKNRRANGFMTALLEQGYQGVRRGHLVVHSMDAFAGAIGISDSDGKCTPEYIVLEPRQAEIVPPYYSWLLRHLARSGYILAVCPAVRERAPRLRYPNLGELRLPVPPVDEQRLIVRCLDWHGSQTAKLIRAKRKLIELLNEQKLAVIHRAVTRGASAGAKMKASGIAWANQVPEHWQVQKLKHITQFRNGLAFKPSDWSDAGVPIIRIQNLNGSLRFNYTTDATLPAFLLIRNGDLLFSWSGNRGTSFGPYIWREEFEGYLNQHIFKLHGYKLHTGYFSHLLRAVTRHIEEETHGIIGLVHITKPELGAVLVPVAPETEQEAIATEIDHQTNKLDAAVKVAQREIAFLQELRTRLITDVVTGKLDVRTAAASLPETVEVETVEDLDENDLEDSFGDTDTEEAAA